MRWDLQASKYVPRGPGEQLPNQREGRHEVGFWSFGGSITTSVRSIS